MEQYPGKEYQPLFELMLREHGTILTVDSLQEIVDVVRRMDATQPPSNAAVDPLEVWQEFSEYVDNDLDGMQLYAGRDVMLYDSFVKAAAKLAASTPQGAVTVKSVLKWLSEYYNEKGEILALVNHQWAFENEHDIDEEPVSIDQVCELYYLQHPDESTPSNQSDAVAFGDWLREQRADVFYGSPTTAQLYDIFKRK
jgi:hypothetical protein